MKKIHGTWFSILTCFVVQTTFCGGQTIAPIGTPTNDKDHITLQKWATCPPWHYTPLTSAEIAEKAGNMLDYVADAKDNIEDNVLNDFEPDFPLAKETIDHWKFHDIKMALCSANLFIETKAHGSADGGNNMGISGTYACGNETDAIILSTLVHEGSHLVSPGKKTATQDLPSLEWKEIDCARARWTSELEACTLEKEFLEQNRVSGWNIDDEYCPALWELETTVTLYIEKSKKDFDSAKAYNNNTSNTPSDFSKTLENNLEASVTGFTNLLAKIKQCLSTYCNN